jgi:hypothetical protein
MTATTPRLSEVAKHLVIPASIETSVYPRVERRLATVGVAFDRWQQGFGSAALGCRADGRYAATIGGVVASIPRQVGKTFTVGHLLLGLAAEFPGMRIIWTSHHARTTTNTFRSMQGMVTRKKFLPLLAPNGIRVANGEQEIRFRNGSIIMFGAREHGFGRGLDAIDVLVFDEAQILSLKALEDMVPAANQSRHVHGALVFFIGTPPRPTDDGEAFAAKRRAAITGASDDQMYVEIAADDEADLEDRKQWAKANPSYPHRTPLEAMLRMRQNIPDDDSWRREALGLWDADEGQPWGVIPRAVWMAEPKPDAPPVTLDDPVTYALEVTSDLKRAWVAAAAAFGELEAVELVDELGDTDRVVSRLVELHERHGSRGVVIDERSPAAVFSADLEAAGVPVTVPKTADVSVAALAITLGVAEGKVLHPTGTELAPVLDAAVGAAVKRSTRETWWIDRRTNAGPFIAASLALWGHRQPVASEPDPEFIVL